ncbi:MAG: phage major capsid protein [Bacteroides xylanisolvens]
MAKEKSITELKDERNQLIARSKEIINGAKTEKRQFKPEEAEELGTNQQRRAEIDLEIEEHEVMNRQQGKKHQPVANEGFSLRRAILAQMNKTEQRASEASVIEDATKLHRSVAATAENCGELIVPLTYQKRAAYTAGIEATTGVVIDEEQQELLLPLEANLVLSQAGVRMMTGLVGNIYWPKHSAAQVFWEGENDEAKDGKGEFSKGKLYSPNRLTAYVDISKQLLIQENRSVEGLIRQLLAVAIAQKVEKTALSNAAHEDNVPDGMFQTLGSVNGVMDWAKIVELETNADLDNALFGNLGYIMHPSLVGKAKTKVKDASGAGGFIFGNDGIGMLNGYRALRTNNIPKGLQEAKDEFGIVFGNWADYFLGQWGAIDLTVDPYTQATKGMVRLVVNSYWNMGMIRPESFTIASMK